MTGIDTNVLVRLFALDNPEQHRKAHALFQSFSTQSPGYISQVSLVEFIWVLGNRYRQPKTEIIEWLTWLVESIEITLENQAVVEQALFTYATTNSDFADCPIERAGHSAGCAETVTFDKTAAKAAGMRLL